MVFRSLLMVLLALFSGWRGPLPVIHQHGGVDELAASQVELGRHLLQAHGDQLEEHWFGWHVHWVWPHSHRSECPNAPHDDAFGWTSPDVGPPLSLSQCDDDVARSRWVLSLSSIAMMWHDSRWLAEQNQRRACCFGERASGDRSVRCVLAVLRC